MSFSRKVNQAGFSAILVLIVILLIAIPIGLYLISHPTFFKPGAVSGVVTNITDNRTSYIGGKIPKYEKFESSFKVATNAQNLQMPYDQSPPPGVPPKIGITVNGEFSQDNFRTVYTQPAFYYQDFDYQVKNGQDWIYPKDSYSWKVRFSPPKEGVWQYRITTLDQDGASVSDTQSFEVGTNPSNHGFIKVSPRDSRYFEHDDGTYFPALGYNYGIDWENNPIQKNAQYFADAKGKGVQLLRSWLSQGGFYSGDHNPWRSAAQGSENDSLLSEKAYPGHDVAWWLDSSNPILFLGWLKKSPAVKPNTNYKVSIRYLMPNGLAGNGLIVKRYGWNDKPCDSGQTISSAVNSPTGDNWQTLQTNLRTGNENFLDNFCLVLDNVSSGKVYIDQIDIREDLGNGDLGVNIVNRPSAALHYNMDQLRSFTFDKILESAHQNDIYFKLVGLEKNDWIFNHITPSGNMTAQGDNNNFYGNERNFTKTRWLQQAWWRYMQARWGYSTSIHSWELLNEGDPFNGNHYALADEFAKYMHTFSGNKHLATTSFWTEFPVGPFWGNQSFSNLDYADFHQYLNKDKSSNIRTDKNGYGDSVNTFQADDFYDTASATERASKAVGAKTAHGANKPTMRGETGFAVENEPAGASLAIAGDNSATWLHKFIWAGINSGGLIESYWWEREHIKDHSGEYGKYLDFIKNIPLSNGNYIDSGASASDGNLRVMGQKDTVNKRAHLWIDNKTNTWKHVIDGRQPTTVNQATITIPGMPAGNYPVLWYNTFNKSTVSQETIGVDGTGNLVLNLPQPLSTDIAVKVGDYQGVTVTASPVSVPSRAASILPSQTPTPTPTVVATPRPSGLARISNEALVKISVFLSEYGRTGSNITSDLNGDRKVDIFDYAVLIGRFVTPHSQNSGGSISTGTPRISNSGLNTSYSPWAVWFVGENITPNLKVRVFDQGNQWGGDMAIVYGDPTSGTFQLPANSAPSGCNSNSSCSIEIQLINGNQASNRFIISIPHR